MIEQEMHLNIRIDFPNKYRQSIVQKIYKEMNGWIGFASEEAGSRKDLPHWFSFDENEKHICASIEPGGLHFSGLMKEDEWNNWKKKIKQIATQELGFKVGEIELGEVED